VRRETFGPKREEEAAGWRKLHNKELYNIYALLYIIGMGKLMTMELMEHAAHTREMRSVYKIFLGKSEEKRPLGRL